ncbi:hypothetical protein [Roseateles sp. BYS87W]|uniref:Uncharacterized protein n=1 Tax=Pelomonas baiyunensis TaxID=3299026 RepID=A0ABW7GZW2_9BURK
MDRASPTIWNSRACLELVRLAKEQHPEPCIVPASAATALCVAGINAVAKRLYRHVWVIDCSPQAERRRRGLLTRLREPLALRVSYGVCDPAEHGTGAAAAPGAWARAVHDGNSLGPSSWLPGSARRLVDARRDERLCIYVSPHGHPDAEHCDGSVIRSLGLCDITVMAAGPVRWHWDG